MKISPKVKKAAPYILGALGLGVLAYILLQQRRASSPDSNGAAGSVVYFGGNAPGTTFAGAQASPTADPTQTGASSSRLRTLPCLIPPCPVVDENGVITVPPADPGGGVVSSPGSGSPSAPSGPRLPIGGIVAPVRALINERKVTAPTAPAPVSPAWDPGTLARGAQATAAEVGRTVHPYGLGAARSRLIDEG